MYYVWYQAAQHRGVDPFSDGGGGGGGGKSKENVKICAQKLEYKTLPADRARPKMENWV